MSQDAAPPPRPPIKSTDQRFTIGLTLFEIGASILTVHIVKNHGGSDFAAYMYSLVPPFIGGLIYWLRTRHASGASAAILAFNMLSATVAFFGSHDSKVLLYKDCAVTGIIGFLFLASLVMAKPLTYYFGQRFATGGTPEGLAWWEGMWNSNSSFRTIQWQTCLVWGIVMLLEAGVKALTIAHTSFQNGYLAGQVMPILATALGVAATLVIARRQQHELAGTQQRTDPKEVR